MRWLKLVSGTMTWRASTKNKALRKERSGSVMLWTMKFYGLKFPFHSSTVYWALAFSQVCWAELLLPFSPSLTPLGIRTGSCTWAQMENWLWRSKPLPLAPHPPPPLSPMDALLSELDQAHTGTRQGGRKGVKFARFHVTKFTGLAA
jgi:hypothetical protein